jgi:hypothetical protein
VHEPLFGRAHQGGAAARGDQRFFQLFALPASHGLLHRLPVSRASQHLQRALAMMGKVGVQLHPPAVPGGMKSGNVVPQRRRRRAIDAQMPLAAKRHGRGARIHVHLLRASGAQTPQLRRRQCRGADGGGGRLTDLEGRWEDRVGAFDVDALQ